MQLKYTVFFHGNLTFLEFEDILNSIIKLIKELFIKHNLKINVDLTKQHGICQAL